jgi:hypothetical protein
MSSLESLWRRDLTVADLNWLKRSHVGQYWGSRGGSAGTPHEPQSLHRHKFSANTADVGPFVQSLHQRTSCLHPIAMSISSLAKRKTRDLMFKPIEVSFCFLPRGSRGSGSMRRKSDRFLRRKTRLNRVSQCSKDALLLRM